MSYDESKPFDPRKNPDKVTHFVLMLRDLGLAVRHYIHQRHPELTDGGRKLQYLAACLVTSEELDSRCDDVFKEAWAKLTSQELVCSSGYRSFERGVVLMNHPEYQTHGEVRLLDPCGEILGGILPNRKVRVQKPFENHLQRMEMQFNESFGSKKRYLVLFSHLIPCTLPDFQCSLLLREYAKRSGESVILSYENWYDGTNTHAALENLNMDNIYIVEPYRIKNSIPNTVQTQRELFYQQEMYRSLAMGIDYSPWYKM